MHLESRAGATLIELVVALAISALVLIVARELHATIRSTAIGTRQRTTAADERALGMATLRGALRGAVSLETRPGPFLGDARSLAFSTRCATGGGWDRPCRVDARIDRTADSSRLVIIEPDRPAQVAMAVAGSLDFRYVGVGPTGTEWRIVWAESNARPLAIAVVGSVDTTVITVRSR